MVDMYVSSVIISIVLIALNHKYILITVQLIIKWIKNPNYIHILVIFVEKISPMEKGGDATPVILIFVIIVNKYDFIVINIYMLYSN